MSALTTRRAALASILGARLAPMAAFSAPVATVSPKLARLIQKSQNADARLNAEDDEKGGSGFSSGSMKAAAALRCRVATFQSASMADVLAKAKHTVAIWGYADLVHEHEYATANGECYLDDMARAVFLDLVRLGGEGEPCA